MRKIPLVLALLASPSWADALRGDFVEHPGPQCRELRDTVLAIVRRCDLSAADAAETALGAPDDSVATDFGTWGFWRRGKQTVVVAVRPGRVVEVSMVDRSGGAACYEKWRSAK